MEIEEGGNCNCGGTFLFEYDGSCSCHICAPCSRCVNSWLQCNKCGWSSHDEDEKQDWFDSQQFDRFVNVGTSKGNVSG